MSEFENLIRKIVREEIAQALSKPSFDEKWSEPLESLGLSVYIQNCLKVEGIRTVRQFVDYFALSDGNVRPPGIGKKCRNQIKEALKRAQANLASSPDPRP